MSDTQRVYAEIDLGAIAHNLRVMRDLEPNKNVPFCAVLKADAYGHGAVPIARMLEHEDIVSSYAVATAEEAVILRTQAEVKKPVMILGYAFPESDEALFAHDIEPSVFREDTVCSLEETAKRLGTDKRLRVHIPVDTGMGRIGVMPTDEGLRFVKRVIESRALSLHGVFTHFSTADEADPSFCAEQTKRFLSFCDRIQKELSFEIPLIHADNSAAILTGRGAPCDMVRAGIAMYGLYPSEAVAAQAEKPSLRPVLSLYSHISFLKTVPAGTPISYGRTYVTDKERRIATIPIGYADGYPRMLSGKAFVLIRGKRAKVLGRICMDQFMADVTEIDGVRAGDRVTLIGTDGEETIDATLLGEMSTRFHYELLCCINKRVPRICREG